ncbi:MAG: Flp pilus assembly protein CpaB [Geminicoccaceae bacterium]
MRSKGLLVLLLGLGLAGGSVLVTHQMLSQSSQTPGEVEAKTTSQIVIARGDIPFGTNIEPQMVTAVRWPEEHIPDGAFLTLEELLGEGNKEPRRARRTISAGDPLVVAKVSNFGEKVTIADHISPSRRAIALRVNDVSGVGGFVTPGDRVDILLTRSSGQGDMEAHTIMQDITVRATDQIADEDRDKPNVVRTVTVEVTPDQAQRLALAQQAGTLSLTLRNGGSNDAPKSLQPVNLDELFNEKRPEAGAPVPSVIINRGGSKEKVQIQRGS